MESINYMLWRKVVLGRLTQIKKDTSADTTQTSQWQIELFSQELCFLFSVKIQSSVKTREDTIKNYYHHITMHHIIIKLKIH